MKKRPFGKLASGEVIDEYTLTNTRNLSARIITYGGILTELQVPDRRGGIADITLGFKNLEDYVEDNPFFGAITGRVAGRITDGKFTIDGKDYALAINDPPNHLHGGLIGLDKRVWTAERADRTSLVLTYTSPDGEEGYPGTVDIRVTYTLTDTNRLTIQYEATTDQDTPLSLTNHTYFNLAGVGAENVEDHVLQIFADQYVPTDDALTLQNRLEPVAGRPNDFTSPRPLGEAVPSLFKQHGDNYVFSRGKTAAPQPVARLAHPESGRVMDVSSTEACLQFYTGAFLDSKRDGKAGTPYKPFAGCCFECQGYPDGVTHPEIDDILLRRDEHYRQTTVFEFSTEY